MKTLYPYTKPYRKQFIIGPICKLLEAILELLLPTLMAYMINDGILKQDVQVIIRYAILMLVMVIVGFIFAIICQYQAAIASQGFGTDVRNAVFHKIQIFSYEDIEHFGKDSFMNRLSQDVNQLQIAVAMMIRLVVRAPFLIIGAIVMAMLLDVSLGLILLGIIPFLCILLYEFMKWSAPLYQQYQKTLDHFSSLLDNQLSNIKTMRVLQAVPSEQRKTYQHIQGIYQQMHKIAKGSAFLQPGMALILNTTILLLLLTGVIQGPQGVSAGVLVALINYATSILSALLAISNLIIVFSKAAVSVKRVEEVLTYPASQIQGERKSVQDSEVAVSCEHVTYAYEQGMTALHDITFCIAKQEVFGIIGGSGAGKSTLLHIITRLLKPNAGQVNVFGVALNDVQEEVLHSEIAYVEQQDTLFHMSILENLCFGLQDVKEEDIKKALKVAQAENFVMELPEGLATIVAEKGSNFSGGQRQRLCIARALLRNPRLLILDDATSALDYKTEAAFRQALKQEFSNTTLCIVSQRSAAVQGCDRVLVLKDGHIAGLGTPKELATTCQAYQEICASQTKGDE